VAGEIEDRVLVGAREIEVAARGDELVAERGGLGHDLSGWRDDGALAEQVAAFFPAALGHADHPGGVLVGPGLHHEVIVEGAERVLPRGGRVVRRRVIAEQDHLDSL